MSIGDCTSDFDVRLNPVSSPQIQGSQSYKGTSNSQMDSGTKLRLGPSPNIISERKEVQNGKIIRQNSSKNSCEQSLNQITPQQRTLYNASQNTNKNQKQPLYSMIPDAMNKKLKNNPHLKTNENLQDQRRLNFSNPKFSQATVLVQQDLNKRHSNNNNNNVYCEESEIMRTGDQRMAQGYQSQNQHSLLNLTPQKKMPIPMSPGQKPIMTSSSNSGQINNGPKIQALNQIQQNTDQKLSYSASKNQQSAQKSTIVQYNEFKYFTSSNGFTNENPKKYININSINNGFGLPKNSLSSNNLPKDASQYELSPGDNQIFDMSSPKTSMLNGQSLMTANSLRKQMLINGQSNSDSDNKQVNYLNKKYNKLLFKSESFPASDLGTQMQPLSDQKIQELKQYIEQLETDLKQSQDKNAELKQKFKDRSFIQSFEKTKKHLSDTEDSLILSEKKGKRRTSLSKLNSQQLSYHQQSTSSIVDVKIRPINNLKGVSPGKKVQNLQMKGIRKVVDLNEDENIEYQVDYNENSAAFQNDSTNPHNCSTSTPSLECDSCERLKQLVFQAKEAIDDLKLEIEEWRDLCAEKEKEIRQIHHKISADFQGRDLRLNGVEFNQEIYTKEFDTDKPVNIDSKKIRNFIQHNKKRIRSRSKNHNLQREGSNTDSKSQQQQSMTKTKSSLKNNSKIRDILLNENYELYQAEDQGIQTSFIFNNENHLTNISHDNGNNNQKQQQQQCFTSNQSTAVQLSSMSPCRIQKDHNSNNQVSENDEIIINLKNQNILQEQEINKLRGQLQSVQKNCEQFVQMVQRVKRKNKKIQNIDLEEIKQNCEIVSNIESYSILEKINEWKREEGLIDKQNIYNYDNDLPVTQIPRPMKLIMDIDPSEIHHYESQQSKIKQQQMPGINTEFMSYIKNEQENLKTQQENKYKELQKQQQEYLNMLKGL